MRKAAKSLVPDLDGAKGQIDGISGTKDEIESQSHIIVRVDDSKVEIFINNEKNINIEIKTKNKLSVIMM